MNPEVLLAVVIRAVGAILATMFAVKYWQREEPISQLARRFLLSVIVFGIWGSVFGALAAGGVVPGPAASFVYTVFSGYAAVIFYALLRED